MRIGTGLLLTLLMSMPLKAQSIQDSLIEMNRKLDILTEEIEKLKLGEVAEVKYEPSRGLGPAASKVYQMKNSGVSIAGYGEIVYENYAKKLDDKSRSSKTDKVDYLRNILYVGYKFNDWILFNSEIEFEHATTGEGAEEKGEASVEFGYIDLMFSRKFNIRAGLILSPVGIINEKHEPTTFFGTLRPQIERSVIPTTWRANGVGFYGELIPSLNYRFYLMEGLNADGFEGKDGVREGRQGGSNAVAEKLALSGKIEYEFLNGPMIGTSFYSGKSGQTTRDASGPLDVKTNIFSVHGEYAWKSLEVRALFAQTTIGNTDSLSALNGETIGKKLNGWYVVAGYDLIPLISKTSTHYLAPFIQYETLNTHAAVSESLTKNRAFNRSTVTAGITYKPHPNVAFKWDFRNNANEKKTGNDQWNLAINYIF